MKATSYGGEQVDVPSLGKREEDLIIADRWIDFFQEDQTVTHNKPTIPETVITSASLPQQPEEEGGGSSLMTQKASEEIYPQALTTRIIKRDISKVNSIRAYVPEGLVLPENCPCKEQIYWFLGLLYWKHLEQRESWDMPVNLKYDHLRDNIPNWPEVWRWCDGWLVHRDRYSPGEKAYGYWTAMPY